MQLLKKIILFSSAGFIMFYVLFMTGYFITSTPPFCSACHEVAPYVASWRQTSHKDVPCLYCHEMRGFVGKLESKSRGLNYLYQQWTGQYTIIVRAKIFEQNCIACHLGDYYNFPKAVRMDYKHHDLIKKDVPCLRCHRSTGHKINIFTKEKFKNR